MGLGPSKKKLKKFYRKVAMMKKICLSTPMIAFPFRMNASA